MEETLNQMGNTKVCAKCGRVLSLDNFYKNKKSGHECYCKDCKKQANKMAYCKRKQKQEQQLVIEGGDPDLSRFTPRQLMKDCKYAGMWVSLGMCRRLT